MNNGSNQLRKSSLELRVLKIEGPFDVHNEKFETIEKNKWYSYKITNFSREPTQSELQNLRWGIKYDDGEIRDLKDVSCKGYREITHKVLKNNNSSKFKIYAFFRAPDEKLSVEIYLKNEFYRFNSLSYIGGNYSKALNSNYYSREDWKAKPPILNENRSFEPYVMVSKLKDKNTKDNEAIPFLNKSYFGIAIHHAGNSGIKTMEEVQSEHVNGKNKFADVGYHFGIDLSGKIYEGRYIGVKGSHLTKYNTGVIGIVFLADFDHEYLWDYDGNDKMSSVAMTSIILLIKALKEQFPNICILGGHNEWKNNVGERRCPGKYGMEYVIALRKKLEMKSPKETGHG